MYNGFNNVNIGDILVHNRDRGPSEVYVYMGKYIQYSKVRPVEKEGHLYCYIGKLNSSIVERALSSEEALLQRIYDIIQARPSVARSFGRFVKEPLTFEERFGNVNVINPITNELSSLRLRRKV